jgi:hypothetical protein
MNEFPDTETRRLSERFAYSPADQEAIDRRDAQRQAAEAQAAQAAQIYPAVDQRPDLAALEAALRTEDRHPLLAEREHTHGNFSATALIAQRFKDVSKNTPNWSGNLTDVQRESLEGIFTKIARILSGDPNHPDHWRDVEGHARLVTETLAPL